VGAALSINRLDSVSQNRSGCEYFEPSRLWLDGIQPRLILFSGPIPFKINVLELIR